MSLSEKTEWIELWSARTGKVEKLATWGGINGGIGAAHHLDKRIGGKRAWYPVAEVESWSDAQKQRARISDADAVASMSHLAGTRKTDTSSLAKAIDELSPAEKEIAANRLAPAREPSRPDSLKGGGK